MRIKGLIPAAAFIICASLAASAPASDNIIQNALSLSNQGKKQEAINLLRTESQKNPPNASIALTAGMILFESGDESGARAELEKAVNIDPSFITAHYTLALLLEKQKDIFSAASQWRRVLELTTDSQLRDTARKHLLQLTGTAK